ncbi:MAG TPA: IS1 family transposase [Dehalococcoidia bacterium]|nr:IS1 family transposase [Dehalococcoidia bacterium]
MNRLSTEQRAKVIATLVEGNSIRATCRITDTAKDTVIRLLAAVGKACKEYQDKALKNLPCKSIQCDEIWSFCYAKEKNVPIEKQGQFGYGDIWTFVAIDAETKLVPSWMLGLRNADYAYAFLKDLQGRLASRTQLTTDGHKMYLQAVGDVFGSDIDYAMLVKFYGYDPAGEARYSPAKCIGTDKLIIQGNPDNSKVSTSYVERQNLTMRMNMRRFTRLTNGFSKKAQNLEYSVALHYMYYNFCRVHKSLANPYPRTPAMAAGLTDHVWTIEEIVNLLSHSKTNAD